MATSKEYMNFIMEQLSQAEGIANRAMMGEYVLYCQGKVVGGVYDSRLLLKPVPGVKALLPSAPMELPYPGAKEMLLVEELEDRDFLKILLETAAAELPAPKPKKKK